MTPYIALLDSVKILSPDSNKLVPLHSVASITVQGQELQVNIFEDRLVKVVEGAIHSANLPGMSPINSGSGTLRIPVTRYALLFSSLFHLPITGNVCKSL